MKKAKSFKNICSISHWSLFILVVLAVWGWVGAQDAPDRPTCNNIGDCQFNEVSEIPGSTVILYSGGGSHGTSKTFLEEAVTRLSQKYGFEVLITRNVQDFTEANMANAKVIIFSSNDNQQMPTGATRARVEAFVEERGWGFINYHAACAFIDEWTWLQDACIQQYYHHNSSMTQGDLVVEDRTVGGVPQGRQSPYTSFMLEGLPDRQTLRDEWYTWRDAPRTTHQYGRQSFNKIMLLRLDENSIVGPRVDPWFGDDHDLVWTHTMGRGIVIYNSTAHDDLYQQEPEGFGDELLWRSIRYVGKDWTSGILGCTDPLAENYNPLATKDDSSCTYAACCGTEGYVEYDPFCQHHDDAACITAGIGRTAMQRAVEITPDLISVGLNTPHAVRITNVSGKNIFAQSSSGAREYQLNDLDAGIYFVEVTASGISKKGKIIRY